MADLKKDLLNDLMNKKYYSEMELVRLAQEPNMNYRVKIDQMTIQLENLALINAEVGLVGQYFQEPVAGAPVQGVSAPPAGHIHPGQTHGE